MITINYKFNVEMFCRTIISKIINYLVAPIDYLSRGLPWLLGPSS